MSLKNKKKKRKREAELHSAAGLHSCYALIASVPSIAAAIKRIREGHFPIEPSDKLSHAANLLYMMTGKKPTPVEERIMDISLILHADHGMNASTFCINGSSVYTFGYIFFHRCRYSCFKRPLFMAGANEKVLYMLDEIGDAQQR